MMFVFKNADQKTRILGIVALALAALAILLLIVSASSTLNGPITKLPLLKLVIPEDELDRFDEQYEDFIEELEEIIDEADEDELEEIEDEYGVSAKKLLKMIDPISINTVMLLADKVEEDSEITAAFSFFVTGIKVYAAILAILVALSALFFNKGWFITSTVLSALFFFAFVGAVWFFVFLALCIAYCILVSKVKEAYIVYKHTPVAKPAPEEQPV